MGSKTRASPQKLHTQKRPEKSLNLHVGLISEDSSHTKPLCRLGKVPVFPNPNFNKRSPGRQRNVETGLIKEQNKHPETDSKEPQVSDFLDKEFKQLS